jgi:hypothetical protein
MRAIAVTVVLSAALALSTGAPDVSAQPLSAVGVSTPLASTPAARVLPGADAAVTISPAGVLTVGGLRGSVTLGTSTKAAVERVWGTPTGAPQGDAEGLAYCKSSAACYTEFDFSLNGKLVGVTRQAARQLNVFGTTVTAKLPAATAQQRLKRPTYVDCSVNYHTGILFPVSYLEKNSAKLALTLFTASTAGYPIKSTSKDPPRGSGGVVTGTFEIDDRSLYEGSLLAC